jgi:hypothetical protein
LNLFCFHSTDQKRLCCLVRSAYSLSFYTQLKLLINYACSVYNHQSRSEIMISYWGTVVKFNRQCISLNQISLKQEQPVAIPVKNIGCSALLQRGFSRFVFGLSGSRHSTHVCSCPNCSAPTCNYRILCPPSAGKHNYLLRLVV